MTKLTVDKTLIEAILESHTKVLETVRDWNNSDDFLWIQYAEDKMRKDMDTLRAALAEPAVETDDPLHCDLCGDATDDPWHFSTSQDRHKHACDKCWESLKESDTICKPPAEVPLLTDDEVRSIYLANGFTVKEGQPDLKPYVFEAARAIEQAVRNNAGLK